MRTGNADLISWREREVWRDDCAWIKVGLLLGGCVVVNYFIVVACGQIAASHFGRNPLHIHLRPCVKAKQPLDLFLTRQTRELHTHILIYEYEFISMSLHQAAQYSTA